MGTITNISRATLSEQRVKTRQVFYIPGYDPFPARRYRELYRKEALAQAKTSGYKIQVSPKANAAEGDYGWSVRCLTDGHHVSADVTVLNWTDLVRKSMRNSIPATYLLMLRTVWIFLSTGTFRRLMWLRKGPVIAALYPIAMLTAQFLFSCLMAYWVGGAMSRMIYPGIGWVVGLPVIVLMLRFFKSQDKRLFAYYLMYDFAYVAQLKGKNPPELEERLQEFKQQVARALASDVDEVLIVGHSSGATLAVNLAADLVREGYVNRQGPKLALLTIGQVIPMMSFLPKADRLRSDLNHLASSRMLSWVDVSAPGDGCSFALCDPVAVTGVSPADKRNPLVISAAFSQTLTEETWDNLKFKFFRVHFQYLCAFDRPKDYDYFQLTAGPLTLADRYAGRAPAKSRIDVPASRYTSLTA